MINKGNDESLKHLYIYIYIHIVWAWQCVETNFILFINDGPINKIKMIRGINKVMVPV